MFKRIFSAVTAAALCLTVSSCGKQLPEPETASKEHVYREDRIELAEELNEINKIMYHDGSIYLLATKSTDNEDGSYSVKYIIDVMNTDGGLEKEFEMDIGSGVFPPYIEDACIDGDGVISVVINDFVSESFTIHRFSSDGEKLGSAKIDEGLEELKSMGSLDLNGFLPLENGRYLVTVTSGKSAAVITSEGVIEKIIKDSNPAEESYAEGLCRTSDGRIFMTLKTFWWDKTASSAVSENALVEVDVEGGKMGESHSIASIGGFRNGTDKYDLLISRDSGLWGYDLETGNTELILDWVKSGIDKGNIEGEINILPDGRIMFLNTDMKWYGSIGHRGKEYISLLSKIPPEELPDRKLIKLFALNLSDYIRQQMLEFNRNNPEYEIELTSYADYEDGLDKMNADMIAGNVPDVLVLGKDGAGYDILADSYISKGLLANLYDFMDSDPDFDRSDYLENYFKAYEVGGKLYEIAPTFTIGTIAGKTSRVGEKEGWTMEEFSALTADMTGEEILGVYRKDHVLEMFLNNCSDSYINRNKGKCYFDSDEFISVLKFCNKFLEENPAPEDYPYIYETARSLREDNQLLWDSGAGTPSDIRILEKGDFGDSVTLKGFPCSKGNGSCFIDHLGIKFAISSRSSVPEGAWRFVKSFLSDEYQEQFSEQGGSRIPIKLSAIEKKYANEQKPYEYVDNNGVTQYINENWYYTGTTDIDIGYPDEADAERMMNFIKTVTTVQRNDRYVTAIVEEEAGAYFAGQKSAEEVAKTIQNRVQNYLDENR